MYKNMLVHWIITLAAVVSICMINSGCSYSTTSNDKTEILSLIFNKEIGALEHYGIPPIPPLPPSFDSLNLYESNDEARQNLKSEEWSGYFQESERFDSRLTQWYKNQSKLDRIIIIDTTTNLNDIDSVLIFQELQNSDIDFKGINKEGRMSLSDIDNKSKYTLQALEGFDWKSLDSTRVGIVSFSKVMFNADKNKSAVYYAWICGGLCGHGSLVYLKRIDKKWVIERVDELWIS